MSKNYDQIITPAMQEYLSSKRFSEKLEHKKIENIESFFVVTGIQEKFKIISQKFQSENSEYSSEELNEIRDEIADLSKTIENSNEKKENISKMMKKLIETDLIIQERLEEETKDGQKNGESPRYSISKVKKSQILKPLHSKFAVLNQKADRFLKSLPTQASVSTIDHSLLDCYHSNQASVNKIAKLPAIRKNKFYDPNPLPPEFSVSKDLMTFY